MGISLFGLTPAATYPALIKFGDNSAISGTLRALSDGLGTDLPIQVSTTGVNFTGTASIGGASIVTNASGVSGAIQFSNGSAFASDAANLFWDDTNNRLGVGTNAPSATAHIRGVDQLSTSTSLLVTDSIGTQILRVHNQANNSAVVMSTAKIANYEIISGDVLFNTSMRFVPTTTGLAINKDYSSPAASTLVHIKGSGSTSATTSLLVQNSAGTAILTVKDGGSDKQVLMNSALIGSLDMSGSIIQVGTGVNIIFRSANGVAFNSDYSSANASAQLDVSSTTKGFLPPRMTTTQRDAIVTPAAGLRIYNTTTNTNDTYNGTAWQSNSVSGVAGAIQFSNGSAFASDAANLFWDDTNNRLGVGTNTPNATATINGNESWAQGFTSNLRLNGASPSLQLKTSSGTGGFMMAQSGIVTYFAVSTDSTFGAILYKGNLDGNNWSFGNGVSGNLGATVGIKGSGSTSATTSLLVQNSGGGQLLSIADSGLSIFNGTVQNTTGPMQALSFATSSSPFNFGTASIYNITGTTPVVTSGQRDGFLGQFTFAPTSGTAILNVLNASPTINQTGGANGITRGLYINPTLTAAADFRAIEVTDGNVLIGNSASNTAKLSIKGSGSTSATTSLLVQNSAGSAALTVRDDREVVCGSSLVVANNISADRAISQAGGSGLTITTSFNSQQNYPRFGLTTDASVFYYQASYNPTSGSGAFAVFNATPTINQTGGANGITRGLYINPTLTAAADFRAIEATNGNVLIGNSASNTAKLSIKGSGSTSATTSLLVQTSAGTTALSVADNILTTIRRQLTITDSTGSNNAMIVYADGLSGVRTLYVNGSVGLGVIGNDASARLQVDSTTQGVLFPRMTTTQKNAIASPAAGLTVYDSTTNKLNYNNGTTWKEITPDGYTGLVTINAMPPVTFDIQNGIIVNVI